LICIKGLYKIPACLSPKKSNLKSSESNKNMTRRVTWDEYEYVTPIKPKPAKRKPTPAKQNKKKARGKAKRKGGKR
jgi:hypothetical protein